MIVVVDNEGRPYPTNSIIFGTGFSVEQLDFGIVRIEGTEPPATVTNWVTHDKELSITEEISHERTVEHVTDVTAATVTDEVTTERERTVSSYVWGTLTQFDVVPGFTQEATVTRCDPVVTKLNYDATVTKEWTVTRETTGVTKAYTVTSES